MEANKLLTADLLDILFDGRNKMYGAYDLRKTYDQRMRKAMFSTGSVVLLLCISYYFLNGKTDAGPLVLQLPDYHLVNIVPDLKITKPAIPYRKVGINKAATTKLTDFKIVRTEVKTIEKSPTIDQIENTRIGSTNLEGSKEDGITAGPVNGNGTSALPGKDSSKTEKSFIPAEMESEYPGGLKAWLLFLNKNLHYPDEAADSEIQGVVIVRFIVDKTGTVSDVEAISGPSELRKEAERVIKKSGKWKPAIQNGTEVKSYKNQPIHFKMGN